MTGIKFVGPQDVIVEPIQSCLMKVDPIEFDCLISCLLLIAYLMFKTEFKHKNPETNKKIVIGKDL